jgi:fucose permease
MTNSKLKFGSLDYAAFMGYLMYAGCVMVLPVILAPMAESLNFPLVDGNRGYGGAIHLWRSVAMFCVMICCAFIAGRFGKRISLGFALIVCGTGLLLGSFAQSYLWIVLAVIFSALGQGGFESLITPTVRELHEKENPASYINITHAFWSIGVVVVVLTTGLLNDSGVSWRIILAAVGALTLFPGIVFLLKRPGQSVTAPPPQSAGSIFRCMTAVLKIGKFWLFLSCMFLAGGAEHCLSFWVPSFIQLEFGQNGFYCGLGTGCFAMGMIGGRLLAGALAKSVRAGKLVLFSAAASFLFSLFPPFLNSLPTFYLLLFLIGAGTGPLWPNIQNHCVETIDMDYSTMYILLPCIGIPGCGFFTWLLGITGDYLPFRLGFLIVPACYLSILLLSAFSLSRRARRRTPSHVFIDSYQKFKRGFLPWSIPK